MSAQSFGGKSSKKKTAKAGSTTNEEELFMMNFLCFKNLGRLKWSSCKNLDIYTYMIT